MTIPRWSTIGLFVVLVMQFVLAWIQARTTGKSFRAGVLPNALIAGAISIAFARELFVEFPVWIDRTLAILCWLLILMALVLWLVRLKRHLKDDWRLEDKPEK
jgi:hypothetical protein